MRPQKTKCVEAVNICLMSIWNKDVPCLIIMLVSVLNHAFPTENFCRIYKKFSVGLFRRVEAECFSVRGKNVYLYSEKRCSFPVMLRKYQWKNIILLGFRFTRNWLKNY